MLGIEVFLSIPTKEGHLSDVTRLMPAPCPVPGAARLG